VKANVQPMLLVTRHIVCVDFMKISYVVSEFGLEVDKEPDADLAVELLGSV
jgi:hypothetical protein